MIEFQKGSACKFTITYACLRKVRNGKASASVRRIWEASAFETCSNCLSTEPRKCSSIADNSTLALVELNGILDRRLKVQRRLRVLTRSLAVARSAAEVFQHADQEAILVVLMHKVGQLARLEGLSGARSLLHKWMVALAARYNLAMAISKGQPVEVAEQVHPSRASHHRSAEYTLSHRGWGCLPLIWKCFATHRNTPLSMERRNCPLAFQPKASP